MIPHPVQLRRRPVLVTFSMPAESKRCSSRRGRGSLALTPGGCSQVDHQISNAPPPQRIPNSGAIS